MNFTGINTSTKYPRKVSLVWGDFGLAWIQRCAEQTTYYDIFKKEHKKPPATENYPTKERLKTSKRRVGAVTCACYKFPEPRGDISNYRQEIGNGVMTFLPKYPYRKAQRIGNRYCAESNMTARGE
jgi:hypothetical protein